MTTEEKFRAAVNVIRSLPKNGSFQPSNDLKLRFYSYYKQATEGPCKQTKPGFWDIVNKAKWEAWMSLGDMPKEEAMEKYVDEIKKIVETMSFSESVAQFMDVLGPFYELVPIDECPLKPGMNGDSSMSDEDLEVVSPENGMIVSKSAGQKRNDLDADKNSQSSEPSSTDVASVPAINGHTKSSDLDSDGDEFSDTYDHMNEDEFGADEGFSDTPIATQSNCIMMQSGENQYWALFRAEKSNNNNDEAEENKNQAALNSGAASSNPIATSNATSLPIKGSADDIAASRGGGEHASGSGGRGNTNPGLGMGRSVRSRQGRDRGFFSPGPPDAQGGGRGAAGGGGQGGGNPRFTVGPKDSNEQLALAVIKLQQNMEDIANRLEALEALLLDRQRRGLEIQGYSRSWWSYFGLSPAALFLLISWPFIAQWIVYVIQKRRRR